MEEPEPEPVDETVDDPGATRLAQIQPKGWDYSIYKDRT
jgi:hypothetical protein